MFSRLGLSAKIFLLLLPLFLLTAVVILFLNHSHQQRSALEYARNVAASQAETIKESIVEMMVVSEEVDDDYLERIKDLGGISELELWSMHERLQLRPQYQTEERIQRLKMRSITPGSKEGIAASETFSSGEPTWRITCATGDHEERMIVMDGSAGDSYFSECDFLNAVVPIKSEKRCQECHAVPVGFVLSALHMDIPMAEPAQALQASTERSILVFLTCFLVSVIIGIVVFRRYVSRPLQILVRGTEIIGSGNLDHHMAGHFSGDELGTLASSFDDMQAKLRDVQKKLLQKERLSVIGQTASAVAHDMRGPLTTISLAVDLLEETATEEERPNIIRIRETVSRMSRMAQELVEFSRGESRFSPQEWDPEEFVSDLSREVSPLMAEKSLAFHVEAQVLSKGWFDRDLIQRALQNLLNNSIDASSENGQIQLRVRSMQKGLQFEVADNGGGIPPSLQSTLFEPFVTAGKEKGTGLGLAITRRIIHRHGGSITFESEEGRGTRFLISLPQNPSLRPQPDGQNLSEEIISGSV